MLGYTEIIARLKKVQKMGYIQTHRKGSTGIGKTLEDSLGIKENNIPGPNAHNIELKSERKNAKAMVTFLTKAPLPAGVNSLLLKKYGYVPEGSEKKKLHTTVNALNFNTLRGKIGFKADVLEDRINVLTIRNEPICYWDEEILRTTFENKYHSMLYVIAEHRGRGGKEEFWYNEAYFLEGFGFDNFKDLVKKGVILIDIRIGRNPNGSAHDHGTGFRTASKNFDLCFKNRKRLI
jgi:hypothetical protein